MYDYDTVTSAQLLLSSPPTTPPDAGYVLEFYDANANHKLLLPSGLSITECKEWLTVPAGEALTAGDFVNLYSNAGTLTARKAVADDVTKLCNGYVLASVAGTENVIVYTGGVNTALSGLTAGTTYFLSTTTGGTVVSTQPTSGIAQSVGFAVGTTAIMFNPERGFVW